MRTFTTAVACLFAASLATTASAVVYGQASAEPIALSVIDTGGDLASTQVILENYKKANPDKVKEIRIQRAPAPELPARSRRSRMPAGSISIWL
jgi:putative spermidine/putrescine transport system substrate-binding protein